MTAYYLTEWVSKFSGNGRKSS